MKREASLKYLAREGCELVREGGSHSIWRNPVNGEVQAVPRHREIKKFTARAICRGLQVEIPKGS